MSVVTRLRERVRRPPTRYERAWLTSINAVGLIVVAGVLFDSTLLLGSGQRGVFQRALYPLVPPAVSLGVALAARSPRGTALSVGALVAYGAVLTAVGTLPAALAAAPGLVAGGVVGAGGLAVAGFVWAWARPD
jgi:hypothetical protein